MLTSLREGAKSGIMKFFLLGFMALAVMGLVFIDMTGSFRDGIGTGSVASVDGNDISTMQLLNGLQYAEQQSGMLDIPQDMRYQLALQVVDNEVRQRVFLMEANDLGFIVSDPLAAREIKKQLQPLIDQGMSAEEALDRHLRATGMSESQYIAAYKQDMALRRLVHTVSAGAYAPIAMVQTAYKYQNQKRAADTVTLDRATFTKQVAAPDDAQIEAFYKENGTRYMTPEYRDIEYAVLTLAKVESGIDLSDENLETVYNENIGDYTLPPRRIVDQAVFQSAETAQEVIGESDDPESLLAAIKARPADRYVLLENEAVTKDDAAGDITEAAFATPLGEITGPIETSLGWVVMAVKSEEPETVQSFEDVKETIRKNYASDEGENRLYDIANEMDEMLAAGMSLSEIASEFDLTVYQTPVMTADGKTRDGKTAEVMQQPFGARLVEDGFKLHSGEMPPLMETDDGNFVAYGIHGIIPPESRPLDDVRAQVIADWRAAETDRLIAGVVKDILEKVKGGTRLKDAAAAHDLAVTAQPPVTAAEAAGENAAIETSVAEALFNLEKEGDIRQAAIENGIKLIQLTDITFPEEDISADKAAQYTDAIAERIRTDILIQYERALRKKYNVKISENAIERAIRPMDTDF